MKAIVLLSGLLLACGGATVDPLDAGGDGSPEAAPDANGSFECGKSLCSGDEICVHPCCGGAPPPCIPFDDDGGTCPAGYTPVDTCYNFGSGTSQGCAPLPCTPPPPYCAPPAPSSGCDLQQGSRDCYEACG